MGRSKKRGQGGDGGSPGSKGKGRSPRGKGAGKGEDAPAPEPAEDSTPVAKPRAKPPLLEMPRSPGESAPTSPPEPAPEPAWPRSSPTAPGTLATPASTASIPGASPPASGTPSKRSNLLSPTASSANRDAKPRARPANTRPPTTPGRGAPSPRQGGLPPRPRSGLAIQSPGGPRSPRSHLSSTRSTPRSPWISSPLNHHETSAVFRPKAALEKERVNYVSRCQGGDRAGSPAQWRDSLGSHRHEHSVVYEVPPDPDLLVSPRLPPPPPAHPLCKEHDHAAVSGSEWKSVIRSAEDIFSEFIGDSKLGKFMQRGMSPRRTEKDFVSGLRPDTKPASPGTVTADGRMSPRGRPEWVGVRPETAQQRSAWQQVPPRMGYVSEASPTMRGSPLRGTDAVFPPPSLLLRERMRASGYPGMMSPRKAEPSWENSLCDGKKETDDYEREELKKIPVLDESLLSINDISAISTAGTAR